MTCPWYHVIQPPSGEYGCQSGTVGEFVKGSRDTVKTQLLTSLEGFQAIVVSEPGVDQRQKTAGDDVFFESLRC